MEFEETPGRRVAFCKATMCKARLSHRNKKDTRDIKENHHSTWLVVYVCLHTQKMNFFSTDQGGW